MIPQTFNLVHVWRKKKNAIKQKNERKGKREKESQVNSNTSFTRIKQYTQVFNLSSFFIYYKKKHTDIYPKVA